jgi:hypothetical protein
VCGRCRSQLVGYWIKAKFHVIPASIVDGSILLANFWYFHNWEVNIIEQVSCLCMQALAIFGMHNYPRVPSDRRCRWSRPPAKAEPDQSDTRMSQWSEPSSILAEILLPGKNLTAYLLDPFVPLLRGFDETTRVFASRPPSEPHIVCTPSTASTSTATNRENRPTKRQRLNNERSSVSLHSSKPGESAETSPTHPLNGFQLEAAHHASIKGDIQHAVDAIRERWIDECSRKGHSEWWSDPHLLRHPAVAQLEWLPSPEINRSEVWVDWAALTRDTFQVRYKTQFDSNQSSIRVSECKQSSLAVSDHRPLSPSFPDFLCTSLE